MNHVISAIALTMMLESKLDNLLVELVNVGCVMFDLVKVSFPTSCLIG